MYPRNPFPSGKTNKCCLLLIAGFDYNNTTVVIWINPPDLDQNTQEDAPNFFCNRDRQSLDPTDNREVTLPWKSCDLKLRSRLVTTRGNPSLATVILNSYSKAPFIISHSCKYHGPSTMVPPIPWTQYHGTHNTMDPNSITMGPLILFT